jgi:hypothetical protein
MVLFRISVLLCALSEKGVNWIRCGFHGLFMKRHIVLIIIFLLLGLFIAFSAASHPYEGPPYDAPLTFIEHQTEDGRDIYTNIPKRCFSGGRLTCVGLHPVFKGPGTVKKPE